MKVIDLLNKIANGEEVPNHIRYDGIDLYYNKKNNCYDLIMSNVREEFYTFSYSDLNNKVEIIEEKKIPEKLKLDLFLKNDVSYYVCNKINEIIDYLKSKGE